MLDGPAAERAQHDEPRDGVRYEPADPAALERVASPGAPLRRRDPQRDAEAGDDQRARAASSTSCTWLSGLRTAARARRPARPAPALRTRARPAPATRAIALIAPEAGATKRPCSRRRSRRRHAPPRTRRSRRPQFARSARTRASGPRRRGRRSAARARSRRSPSPRRPGRRRASGRRSARSRAPTCSRPAASATNAVASMANAAGDDEQDQVRMPRPLTRPVCCPSFLAGPTTGSSPVSSMVIGRPVATTRRPSTS